MKRLIVLWSLLVSGIVFLSAQGGYKVGDVATDFKLKNVNEKVMGLSSFPEAKGYIVIFTCNHCPYSIAYEDRIIELNEKYAPLGFPVIAISSNSPKTFPADSFEKMQERAKDKNFTFPYLIDEEQAIYPIYGAVRTPHTFVLEKTEDGNVVRYIGAIDDNYEDADAVKTPYLANAVDFILAGEPENINPSFTKAIGCGIK